MIGCGGLHEGVACMGQGERSEFLGGLVFWPRIPSHHRVRRRKTTIAFLRRRGFPKVCKRGCFERMSVPVRRKRRLIRRASILFVPYQATRSAKIPQALIFQLNSERRAICSVETRPRFKRFSDINLYQQTKEATANKTHRVGILDLQQGTKTFTNSYSICEDHEL